MSKEIRSIKDQIKRGEEPESRKVRGYASLFNSESKDLGGFTEIIAVGAFDGVVERSDVLCVLNHNPERGVLARNTRGAGSLVLGVDDKGLFYEFDAPRTALGDELLEALERGDIRESSFAFTVEEEKWENIDRKTAKRTILKVGELFDVSPVYFPAYDGTEVSKRFEEMKNKREEQEDEKEKDLTQVTEQEKEEEKKKREEDKPEEEDEDRDDLLDEDEDRDDLLDEEEDEDRDNLLDEEEDEDKDEIKDLDEIDEEDEERKLKKYFNQFKL